MRKLVESTFVTLDGVIDSPQRWSGPYWDDEHFAYARDLLFASDALLLCRETYEGFAAAWPSRPSDTFVDRINQMPKYVASRTLQPADMKWNATLVQGDVAGEVARLKERPGQSILKYGTGELDRTLMAHNLVDEFHFWLFPVAAGSGVHLFDGIELTHLNLKETHRFASGIVVLVYAPK
jgi:dihydrofolate reductase